MALEYVVPQSEDLDQIIALLKSVNGDYRDIQLDRFIVAKENDQIIGCIRTKDFKDGSVEIASLAVNYQYRGKGIGAVLVSQILEKDTRRPVYVLCMRNNLEFYKKCGFTEINSDLLPDILKEEFQRILEKFPGQENKIISMTTKSSK